MMKQKQNFKNLVLLFLFLFSVKGFGAYYWVGGSGNWSDINHWRTSSGGTSIPLVVPGQTDDVYFDANSGFTAASKTVTVNVPANMRDITFSGSAVAPVFKGAITAKPINIYGSSVWQAGMEVSNLDIYYRNTNTPKTIKSNGLSIRGTVLLEEETLVSLMDDFSVLGTLTHSAGIFTTNNHKVTVESYSGDTGSKSRTLNLGSSDFYITGTMYSGNFSASSSYLTLNAGTSHIRFTGVMGYPTVKPYAGQHYYNISFENPGLVGNLGYNQNSKVYYNRITMNGNGNLRNDNEIKELILAEGSTYSLGAFSTQTITGILSAHIPDCGNNITISSSVAGNQAEIVAASGVTIDVSGAILRDINASGGAVFNALQSVDTGNNTGWVFSTASAKNLYWVGGSGNWNDVSHWSFTPGGAGGACIPGPNDNVFFNAASGFTDTGKTVTVNTSASMRDITFSGSAVPPVFKSTGASNPINIYGSSEWQTGMEVGSGHMYYRNNNTPKTITSNGVSLLVDYVYFEEKTSITLLDNFSATGKLTHLAGTFSTDNHNVKVMSYLGGEAYPGSPRTLNLGNSVFSITGNMYLGKFSANSSTLTINAGTSHIYFTSGGYGSLEPYAGQHYYDVTFNGSGWGPTLGYTQTGKVYYNRVEFKGNGNFLKDNEIRELVLAEGQTYTLDINGTQTITSKLTAYIPGCGNNKMTIRSSVAGTQAKIVAASGVTIDVSGTILKDINASGGASFSALESTDNGNNTGWTFADFSKTMYWVGGSGNWNDTAHWSASSGGAGGYCVPGPKDDVFFNAGSGFTSASKTITVNASASMRNVIFSGSPVPPVLKSESASNPINIYGSSEWQTGMEVKSAYMYYRNTNTAKTITSNGVSVVVPDVYFEEETSVSLLDDLVITSGTLHHDTGTLTTNNHKVSVDSYLGDSVKPKKLNMGSSEFYITGVFSTASSALTLDTGTSHIHFIGSGTTPSLKAYAGQHYYNVSFEVGGTATVEHDGTGSVIYNIMTMKGNGILNGDNQFKELILTGAKKYTLQAGKIQKVTDQLYANGSSCYKLEMVSSVVGTKAILNVLAGNANFDFANVRDINASGIALHFGAKSSDAGNNTNISFKPYDPGTFSGFEGMDWSCTLFKDTDPASYTLSSAGFFGNPTVKYEWTKLNDPAHTGIISTADTLDMRPYGLGTYHLKVVYSTAGPSESCTLEESIIVGSCIPSMINPGLPIRNY